MKTHTYHIKGLHCPSCKILIEDIVQEQEGIVGQVHIKKQTLTCDCKNDETIEENMARLSPLLSEHGYELSQEKQEESSENNGLIWQALPIGLVILALFFALQKSGILNFSVNGSITPTTSFIIGLIASISSCLAIVGGLILSLSAQMGYSGTKGKSAIILFHSGRILGFAVLGGILGMIGSTIGISVTFSSILGLIAALVMIVLGLNLAGVFKKSAITLPSSIFSFFRKGEGMFSGPLLIGIGTFFLPCGFTQSMQISALSSGSFLSGLLIMLFFALGTFPVLALLSFGSASFAKSRYAPLFFKSVGIVVIGLGAFSLITGLTSLGIIPPIINF
ncbi:MAG: sulfite exporter TauE/SafE family protein [Candidatus Gracilibacteria bacterium]